MGRLALGVQKAPGISPIFGAIQRQVGNDTKP